MSQAPERNHTRLISAFTELAAEMEHADRRHRLELMNAASNGLYEALGWIDRNEFPDIEDAIQTASEAADTLSLETDNAINETEEVA